MFKCQDQVGGLGSIIALIIPVATREREREREGKCGPKYMLALTGYLISTLKHQISIFSRLAAALILQQNPIK